jgi:hypothetical protein
MQLVKAALAIVTLEHCIQARADCTPQEKAEYVDQLYRDVRIVPALWRLDGFNKTVLDDMDEAHKDRCEEEIRKCAVPKGRYILSEMAAGHHVTYPVAHALQGALATIRQFAIVTARRATAGSGKGNVKPACPSFCLP